MLAISSSTSIDLIAKTRRPLRSKRASTSPVRARSKASGLTRIRVRLTCAAPFLSFWSAWRRLLLGGARGRLFFRGWRGSPRWGGWRGGRRGGFFARLPFRPLAAGALLERSLAIGAERPAGVDRLAE